MIFITCQLFRLVEDKRFLRIAQAMNPRYKTSFQNHIARIIFLIKIFGFGQKVNAIPECAI